MQTEKSRVDPRRLLSISNPLIAGRDLRIAAHSARFTVTVSDDPRWNGQLTFSDYLELSHALKPRNPSPSAKLKEKWKDLVFVLDSIVLWDPTSPKQKEYQGHIAIGTDENGMRQFVALITNGPSTSPHSGTTVYLPSPAVPTPTPQRCLEVINDHISNKLDGRGSSSRYVRKSAGPSQSQYLGVNDFDRAFRQAAGH